MNTDQPNLLEGLDNLIRVRRVPAHMVRIATTLADLEKLIVKSNDPDALQMLIKARQYFSMLSASLDALSRISISLKNAKKLNARFQEKSGLTDQSESV